MVELYCVPKEHLKETWPHVAHLLRAAVEKTGLGDFADLERDIHYGHGELWLAWSGKLEAAATTSLQNINGQLVCVVTACGGADRERWLHLLGRIETYAKAEGCKCVRIFGRKAWQRELRDYDVTNIVLEKAL